MGDKGVSRVMRSGAVMLAGALVGVSGQADHANAQQIAQVVVEQRTTSVRRVTVDFQDALVRDVVKAIAEQAGLSPAYAEAVIPVGARVSVRGRNVPVDEAFTAALRGTGLVAKVQVTGNVVIFVDERKNVEQGTIVGKVVDAKTKQPMSGATVFLDDATTGIVTGPDGQFRIAVAVGEHQIRVQAVGFVRQAKKVVVKDGMVSVEIVLEQSASVLDEVVVTGTVAETERRAIPNAITVVTAKDIEERGITRIDQLFRGDVPGVFSSNVGATPSSGYGSDGGALDEVVMFSRGATGTSISSGDLKIGGVSAGTNAIKTYIDGVELADPRYLSQIDPNNIERIEILTGPQASTVYGSGAMSGVMQIFTKRGGSTRPRLSVAVTTGWVESQFSRALAPRHSVNGQVDGVEGAVSYNIGATWAHESPWTPAQKTRKMSQFGGVQISLPSHIGPVRIDGSLRNQGMRRDQYGNAFSQTDEYLRAGWYSPRASAIQSAWAQNRINKFSGRTAALSGNLTLFQRWSHEIGYGYDVSLTEARSLNAAFRFLSDTLLDLSTQSSERQSFRYRTTVNVDLLPRIRSTSMLGADQWRSFSTQSIFQRVQSLSGTAISMAATPRLDRQDLKNKGMFFQSQVGVLDQLFLTYGVRLEWNPAFGDENQPDVAPRYGVSYAFDVASVSAKLRASYGTSTRPPQLEQKASAKFSDNNWPQSYIDTYGDIPIRIANEKLGPEYQRGSETGVEVYWGNRGGVVITYYNQSIKDLVWSLSPIDSARSLRPLVPGEQYQSRDDEGYGYWHQSKYVNVGTIRNQGWELSGNANVGPIALRGTYSWTKSRTAGVRAEYSHYPAVISKFQPGQAFRYMTEHTWAFSSTYSHRLTSATLSFNGIGQLVNTLRQGFYYQHLDSQIRLSGDRYRVTVLPSYGVQPAYYTANLSVTHRLPYGDLHLRINNIGDFYRNDSRLNNPVIGRQTEIGFRVRL